MAVQDWFFKNTLDFYWLAIGTPHFIVFHFIALHICCVFYKLKVRPSTSKNIMSHFIEILTLWQWPRSKTTISLRYACNHIPQRKSIHGFLLSIRTLHGFKWTKRAILINGNANVKIKDSSGEMGDMKGEKISLKKAKCNLRGQGQLENSPLVFV